jgi:hypothetical protein
MPGEVWVIPHARYSALLTGRPSATQTDYPPKVGKHLGTNCLMTRECGSLNELKHHWRPGYPSGPFSKFAALNCTF